MSSSLCLECSSLRFVIGLCLSQLRLLLKYHFLTEILPDHADCIHTPCPPYPALFFPQVLKTPDIVYFNSLFVSFFLSLSLCSLWNVKHIMAGILICFTIFVFPKFRAVFGTQQEINRYLTNENSFNKLDTMSKTELYKNFKFSQINLSM